MNSLAVTCDCDLLLYCVYGNRVGPLDSQLQYSVTASKEGFVFTPTADGILGHFRSFKLGKILVQVCTRYFFANLIRKFFSSIC